LASKRLLKQPSIGQLKAAIESESQEFMKRVSGPEAKEALSALLEKRPLNFTKSQTHAAAE
jgi:hypothetical protein